MLTARPVYHPSKLTSHGFPLYCVVLFDVLKYRFVPVDLLRPKLSFYRNNELGRGGVDAEAAACGVRSQVRGAGSERTSEKPAGISPTSAVSPPPILVCLGPRRKK